MGIRNFFKIRGHLFLRLTAFKKNTCDRPEFQVSQCNNSVSMEAQLGTLPTDFSANLLCQASISTPIIGGLPSIVIS